MQYDIRCRIVDHAVLGWTVDMADPGNVLPRINDRLPAPAPDTSPIISPRWAYLETRGSTVAGVIENPWVCLPGPLTTAWRGSMTEFLDFLATNNGAVRKLESKLALSRAAYNTFLEWSRSHLDLIMSGAEARGFAG
jgi:hypothetical protein